MNPHRRSRLPLLLTALLAASVGGTAGADGTTAVAIAHDQVERGAAIYRASCGFCHGAELQGGGFPALSGPAFAERWDGRPLGELFAYAKANMPLGQAGSLADEAYADVIAFVLSRNGVEPGDTAFTGDDEAASATLLTFAD